MDEQARLELLLDACNAVLPRLTGQPVAAKVRETCAAIENRLKELQTA